MPARIRDFLKKTRLQRKIRTLIGTLGSFSVHGYTRAITDDENPVFLKTVGDEVVLNFQLKQDINALNNDKSLLIANDKKAYDHLLYKDETAFGRGALIIRKDRCISNKKGTSQLIQIIYLELK